VPVVEKPLVVTLSELRRRLPNYRRRVQRGEVLSVEYYTAIVGYLIPLAVAESLKIEKAEEMRLIDFRDNMNTAWERLDQGVVDCLWLTYHDRRVIAFVSERIYKGETA
jgi:hypothetical protein